jgi:hypothetical protein
MGLNQAVLADREDIGRPHDIPWGHYRTRTAIRAAADGCEPARILLGRRQVYVAVSIPLVLTITATTAMTLALTYTPRTDRLKTLVAKTGAMTDAARIADDAVPMTLPCSLSHASFEINLKPTRRR